MVHLIDKETIAEAWDESIRLLLSIQEKSILDTSKGFSIELRDVIMHVKDPRRNPKISEKYQFPQEFIDALSKKLNDPTTPANLMYQRVHYWQTSSGTSIDQFDKITELLKRNPETRSSLILLWDPMTDLESNRSMSPVFIHPLIRNQLLCISVYFRSEDAWMGALPDMVAFVEFAERLASNLDVRVGEYTHYTKSYHLYEADLYKAKSLFSG